MIVNRFTLFIETKNRVVILIGNQTILLVSLKDSFILMLGSHLNNVIIGVTAALFGVKDPFVSNQ